MDNPLQALTEYVARLEAENATLAADLSQYLTSEDETQAILLASEEIHLLREEQQLAEKAS